MTEDRHRDVPAGRRAGHVGAVASVVLTSVGAYLALELWRARLSVPFRYSQIDDTKFYFGLVKGIIEHGWYQHNPSLAAPFGQVIYDFPQGADNLNFLLIKALSLLSSNYALVTNLFFLLTFPLTGFAAYHALRGVRLGPAVATVCAVLFALLPYHFYRHESQVLLSAYYSVPLGAYLFLSLFGDKPLLARRDGDRPPLLAWASRRTLGTIAACVVIGSGGLYYAVFTLGLLIAATTVALVARRGRGPAIAGTVACVAIAITLLANLAPSLIYSARHGGNHGIARTPLETEQLGLRVSNLVLPVRNHRLPALSGVNTRYAAETSPRYCESCNETLGVVGTVGFVLLCLIGLAAVIGAAGASGGSPLDWQRPYRAATLGVAIACAIGTIGGISSLVAFLITPDVRGWNRISLFVAFFSLLAAGLLLAACGRRLRSGGGGRPGGRRTLAGALLAAVLILGWLDETSTYFVVDYAAAGREYRSDQEFGRAIEARLPPGSSVLELPYVPFPEGYHIPGLPPVSAFSTSYDLLRPYLSTRGLHWSFGAVKGRPSDWEAALAAKRLDVVTGAAVAAGFQAIYVDARGYDPGGAQQVRAGLTRLLGAGPLESPRRDAWLFDLRPYSGRLAGLMGPAALAAAREATLRPLRTACGPIPSRLELINPAGAPRVATLTASLTGPLPGGANVLIAFPGGSTEQRVLGSAPVKLHRRLVVAPGRSEVRVTILGQAPVGTSPATPAFVVSQPTLTDDALARLRARPTATSSSLPLAGLVGPTCSDLFAASAASRVPSGSPPRPAARSAAPAF